MDHESKLLGLQINWSKTTIQSSDTSVPPGTFVPVAGDKVEVIESFTYLGVNIHNTGPVSMQCCYQGLDCQGQGQGLG